VQRRADTGKELEMANEYASGDWLVKQGREDEFVATWRDWLSRSSSGIAGFNRARLLRSNDDPGRYTSFSEWSDAQARDAWKQSPDFAEGFSTCKGLCDEFRGGDFTEVVQI
jgi:heme-degrading monooxygenase HmoA